MTLHRSLKLNDWLFRAQPQSKKQPNYFPGGHLAGTPFRQIQQLHAPSIEAARAIGEKGSPPIEAERLAFEAWMQGHCWVVGGVWDGITYRHPAETGAFIDAQTMLTRQLWAAWRDRAALSVADDSKTDIAEFDSPERTGVGDWCAPGSAAEQKRQWLLLFEDREKRYQLYENEADARVVFARSETMGWNCHLFQHVPRIHDDEQMSGWTATTDKLHPDKPGQHNYEQVPCLIVKNRVILIRLWNCEHLVWDGEDGDDFYCKAEEVSHWMLLTDLLPAQ